MLPSLASTGSNGLCLECVLSASQRSKTFAFFFKIPEDEARRLNPKMTRDFVPLFRAAHKRLTGD